MKGLPGKREIFGSGSESESWPSWKRPAAWLAWLLLLVLIPFDAVRAEARIWIDRDRLALDETLTLTIETDVAGLSSLPDPYLMGRDFRTLDHRTSQETQIINGQVRMKLTMVFTLQPLHEGEIVIPTYDFGGARNETLRVTVLPPRATPAAQVDARQEGRAVFLETQVDTRTPYVQQTVGYSVKLYYLPATLLDGALKQDPPEGANLQQLGEDREYSQSIGGRTYRVAERRFLLVPDRAGKLVVPGARFEGRSVGGLFGDFFGDMRSDTQLSSTPLTLQVKPLPATAQQPWLPLRGLRMRYLEAPQSARVGEAAKVVVEVVAEGASAAQLPSLELRAEGDAQVLAEPVQTHERFVDGRPQVIATRTFSVIPGRVGRLQVRAPRLNWWDADADTARVSALQDLQWQVLAGANIGPAIGAQTSEDTPPRSGLPTWLPRGPWLWIGIVLVALWLAALTWGWRLWSLRGARASRSTTISSEKSAGGSAPAPVDGHALKRALASGDLGLIARSLCMLAQPPVSDLDALRRRLADPEQRAAIEALQQARWGGGDPVAARAALRKAFAQGPRWLAPQAAAVNRLPPLYPS
ncbi:MAG: protein BatD [Lysobacteraceae bacterium]|nr:MAG: protein BatD [Xanthomonadaceae bacterium]